MVELDISHAIESAVARIAELEAQASLTENESQMLEAHKAFVATTSR